MSLVLVQYQLSNKYWDSSFFRVPGVSWTFQFPGVLIDHPRFSSFNFKERCFSSTHQRKTTSNSMLCVTISNFNLFFCRKFRVNSNMTKRSILPPTYQSIHIVDISGVIPRLVLNAVELNFKVKLLSFKEKISKFFSQYYSLLILAMIIYFRCFLKQ